MNRLRLLAVLLAVFMILPLLPTGLISSAVTTEKSTYVYDGTEYVLYTGFTQTSGSTGFSTNENSDKLVDGDMSKKMCCSCSDLTAYVEFNATDAFAPSGYIFTTAGDTASFPNRNPVAWTIKAKLNPEDAWTTIENVESDTVLTGVNNTDFAFALDFSGENAGNYAEYKYFRVDFKVVQDSTDGKKFQLAEMRFFGQDHAILEITARPATCEEIGYSRNCYMCMNKYYADAACTQELPAADVEIAKLPHTPVYVAAQAHTATANGVIAHYECSVCHRYFADQACTTELTGTQIIDFAPVPYINESGASAVLNEDFTVVSLTDSSLFENGWYVVYEDQKIEDRILVSGDVKILLFDGVTLTLTGGITVPEGSSLSIYAQSTGENAGALVADANLESVAAIGGIYDNSGKFGTIAIYGGKITATGRYYGAGIGAGRASNSNTDTGSSVIIAGGTVVATGGYQGAGIGGSYYTKCNVTITGGTVTATGGSYGAGIGGGYYAGSGAISISGGTINATGGSYAAGIGSGYNYSANTINISGGSITAKGGSNSAGIGGGSYGTCGTTTISAGTIDATGGSGGPGIGSGYSTNGGTITITGGNITATAGSVAAGIGGGSGSKTTAINIEGGVITATAGNYSAAIGGGGYGTSSSSNKSAGNITISGGQITAIATAANSRGIGDSYMPSAGDSSLTISLGNGDFIDTPSVFISNLTINGVCSIEKTGEPLKIADIYLAKEGGVIRRYTGVTYNVTFVDSDGVTVLGESIAPASGVTTPMPIIPLKSGYTFAGWTKNGAAYDFSSTVTSDLTLVASYTANEPISYINENGETVTTSDYVVLQEQHVALTIGSGLYTTNGDLTFSDAFTVDGNVSLILKNGTTLTTIEGITVNAVASLKIFGQPTGEEETAGKLVSNCAAYNHPAIGWMSEAQEGSFIAVYGGEITAKGAYNGAGIGGGNNCSGGNVIIAGGKVTATGGTNAAGIGGGYGGAGGTILISGGDVTATGGNYSAGIGGGDYGVGGNITITGGTVNATGNGSSAGIGGGYNKACGTIVISGGVITAKSNSSGAAGIGCGSNSNGGSIIISGGQITVLQVNNTSGIGGSNENGSTIIKLGYTDAANDFILSPAYRGTISYLNSMKIDGTDPIELAGTDNIDGRKLVASGIPNFIITFVDEDGTTVIDEQSVVPGNKAESIVGPDKSAQNKIFIEWLLNGASYDFDLPVNEDITLTASYLSVPTPAGAGTESNPFKISSKADWEKIAAMVNDYGLSLSDKYVKLLADIEVTTAIGVKDGANGIDRPFCGTFDGNGFTLILNLEETAQGAAPFRYVHNATVKNVKTAGTVISSEYHASGLVGFADGVTITNCLVSADIRISSGSSNVYSGGVIGHALSAPFLMEGVVFNGSIDYVEGVSATMQNVGGLVAWDDRSVPTINNCLNVGTFKNAERVAPIARVAGRGTITNCYYTFSTSSRDSQYDGRGTFARIISGNDMSFTVTDGTTYSVSGISISDTGLSYAGKVYAASGVTVPFTAAFTGGQEGAYVFFTTSSGTLTQSGSILSLQVDSNAMIYAWLSSHAGTENDPYTIGSAEDWGKLATYVNEYTFTFEGKYFSLTNDISVTTMIGQSNNKFRGVFDGSGNSLTFNYTTNESVCAPFRYVDGATIKNLAVNGTITSSASKSAGLIGYSYGNVTILNCLSDVTIDSSYNGDCYSSGFVSFQSGGSLTITGCVFTGKLLGTSSGRSAGFLGNASNSPTVLLNDCIFAASEVTMSTYYGATFCRNVTGAFNNCYYFTPFNEVQGKAIRTVAAGSESVTVAAANVLVEYDVSGISALADGMVFNNMICVASGSTVELDLSYSGQIPAGETAIFEASAGTLKNNGEHFVLTMPNENVTITAQTGVSYFITLSSGNGGTIAADNVQPKVGETVTLTARPDAGKVFNTLSVTCGSDNVEYTVRNGNAYTFAMPEGNVTVTASFKTVTLTGTGTQEDPYVIATADDWAAFASKVNNGETTACAILTADIPVNVIIGSEENKYSGVFNGNGHTLTVSLIGCEENTAPFRYAQNATFKYLTIAGSIETAYKRAAGFVAVDNGSTFRNCRSSVSITSTVSGETLNSGFVSSQSGTTTFVNCLFDGELKGSSATNNAGFVATRAGTIYYTNCWFRPSTLSMSSSGSACFNRDNDNSKNIFVNCWYSTSFNSTQYQNSVGSKTDAVMLDKLGVGWTTVDEKTVPAWEVNNISHALIDGLDIIYKETGEEIVPTYTVYDLDGKQLTAGVDYTVSVDNQPIIGIGIYTFTFTGRGAYTGTQLRTIRVSPYDPLLIYDENLFGVGSGGWYITVPSSGTKTVDLTNLPDNFVFYIYDHGGKNENYTNYCDGALIINGPSGCVLQFTGSGVTEGTSYDWAFVYDSDLTTALTQRLGGSFTLDTIFTTGKDAKVTFRTDSSSIYAGFELCVSVVSLSSSFDVVKVTNENGTVSGAATAKPNDTVTLTLTPNANCVFASLSIVGEDGRVVEYTIDGSIVTFTMPVGSVTVTAEFQPISYVHNIENGECLITNSYAYTGSVITPEVTVKNYIGETLVEGVDYVITTTPGRIVNMGIYDLTVTGIGSYTGAVTAKIGISPDEDLSLNKEEGYFYLNLPETGTVELDLSGAPAGFSFVIYDNGGKNGNYTNGCSSGVVITTKEGNSLVFSGSGDAENGWDYLYIYDTDGTTLLGSNSNNSSNPSYTGSFQFSDLKTTSNGGSIRFTSDSSNTRAGFAITATIVTGAQRGDVNEDGDVTVADVSALLDYIAGTNLYAAVCDLNDDGDVTVADVSALLDLIATM